MKSVNKFQGKKLENNFFIFEPYSISHHDVLEDLNEQAVITTQKFVTSHTTLI